MGRFFYAQTKAADANYVRPLVRLISSERLFISQKSKKSKLSLAGIVRHSFVFVRPGDKVMRTLADAFRVGGMRHACGY